MSETGLRRKAFLLPIVFIPVSFAQASDSIRVNFSLAKAALTARDSAEIASLVCTGNHLRLAAGNTSRAS